MHQPVAQYEPYPDKEYIGSLTGGNTAGSFMVFSPVTEVQKDRAIVYTSFDYDALKYVTTHTRVRGYVYVNIEGYIFYLPYAYDPNNVLAKPGYSGSAIYYD
jgi:hypothetical protein